MRIFKKNLLINLSHLSSLELKILKLVRNHMDQIPSNASVHAYFRFKYDVDASINHLLFLNFIVPVPRTEKDNVTGYILGKDGIDYLDRYYNLLRGRIFRILTIIVAAIASAAAVFALF